MMNFILLAAAAFPPPPLAVPQSCDSLDGLDLPSFVAHATETPDSGFERGMMAIFYNVLDTPLERYWDDRRGTGGMYQGVLPAHGTESVGTYAGDTFFFRSIVPNGGGAAAAPRWRASRWPMVGQTTLCTVTMRALSRRRSTQRSWRGRCG